ncbi:MAG: bifunctional folylpolyglutamate synthase/dihydrofolate synthase [Candidatus Micrarchaeota archaeon]|nr:bifunctional folylpolyglutamate synthase/dihydrofolate synthase [Candidatus Micrarchaeota archaeon]
MDRFLQSIEYLESLMGKERDKDRTAGMRRMNALLDEMGDPYRAYPTVHVGGTAGKGSTSMMLAEMLRNSGFRTGLHVSPHLEDIRERMQVDSKFMTEAEFADLVDYLRPVVERVRRAGGCGWPSYFEVLLAITFEHFKRKKVDIAVIEVGMGGKYDGSNVIKPYVAVLTNVGLDHTEYLGDTVERIAMEKVGIFKGGIDVLTGVDQPSVIRIVEDAARDEGCTLFRLGKDIQYRQVEFRKSSMKFDLEFEGKKYDNIILGALGEHQVRNASLAFSAAARLRNHGIQIRESTARETLREIRLPGRFEALGRNPTVIIDGAHNPMKMHALSETLRRFYRPKTLKTVFAASKTKDIANMLEIIGGLTDQFYLTRFQAATDFGRKMACDPEELREKTDIRSMTFDDAPAAYEEAVRDAGANGTVCITGSLYLVGELRTYIKNRAKP